MDEPKSTPLNKTQKAKLIIDLEFEFVSETLVIKCYAQHRDYLRNTVCYTATPLSKVELIILKFGDILRCLLVTEMKDHSKALVIVYYPQSEVTNDICMVKKRRRRVLYLKANDPIKLEFWRDQIYEHCLAEFGFFASISRTNKKLLAFVNPFSGPGRALQIFEKKVSPVFSDAGVSCRVIVTEKAQQAQKWARTMRLDEWDGLVVVSGDGLVFE
uniref:DAGKc domain-containing protein n=1 Tax=Romanomermis culicivorax TaxID=13658 RepID=A0A915KQM1_ROMCU